MTDTGTHTIIVIDLDKKCAECGKGGAMPSQLCIACTTKIIFQKKNPKTWQGRAIKKRWDVRDIK